MERRSLFDSVSLATRDFGQHARTLLLLGAAYALMNFIMQLPGVLLDVAAIFDGVFQGQIPTFNEMSSKQQMATLLQTGIFFMSHLVNAILWVGGLQLALAIVDGKPFELWDALCSIERVPLAIGWAVYGLVIFPAFMCCLLPGFVLKAALFLWPLVSIDRSFGGAEALGPCLELFRKNLFGLTGICFLVLTLSMIGATCFHVGSVFTFPITLLTTAHAYRLLVPNLEE